MEHMVLFTDICPYIVVWTFVIILILLVFVCKIWRFGKKHPEIFRPDTTAEDKQMRIMKAELRRRYTNKLMQSLLLIFIWMIGVIAICFAPNSSTLSGQAWFILAYAMCGILWVLLFIQRKPK